MHSTEQEAHMEPTTRWQNLSTEQVTRSATLVDSFATNQRLRPFVEAAIEATAAGEIVPGTSWTKEAAADVLRLWDVLGAFLGASIREGGPTPLEVISRYA
jgi:predicted phosphatase